MAIGGRREGLIKRKCTRKSDCIIRFSRGGGKGELMETTPTKVGSGNERGVGRDGMKEQEDGCDLL